MPRVYWIDIIGTFKCFPCHLTIPAQKSTFGGLVLSNCASYILFTDLWSPYMVHEVDSQAEAGLEPRLKTVPFTCFWIETSCENWKVNGTGTEGVSLFIYLFILLLLLLLNFYQLFFFCGGGFLWPRFQLLLIVWYITPLLFCLSYPNNVNLVKLVQYQWLVKGVPLWQ